ncbi:MAG: hypothetical protein QXU32_12330 [Nitrososphaerales archaeon]
MLDPYKILRVVEDEIAVMKKRQQTALAVYQQQTREDIMKKFAEADHTLLEAAEKKVKEINRLKNSAPYLISSARKVTYVSVRRIEEESRITVEIDPIVYPSPFNLKFVLNEPSVGLYNPSSDKGTISMNSVTTIRATDLTQSIEPSDLDSFIDLWITHKADESFVTKLKAMKNKVANSASSVELALELMLTMSLPMPPRQLIYICEDHDKEPTHRHERLVPPSSVKGLLKHHLKLN